MRSLCFGLCDIAARIGWAATCALVLTVIALCWLIDAAYGWPYGALVAAVSLSVIATYGDVKHEPDDNDVGLEFNAYYDALARDREGIAAIRHKLSSAG